jgi:oligopeptide transport system permease protein
MRRIFAISISNCLTLAACVVLTFLLLKLVPGGPFDSDRVLPPEVVEALNQKFGTSGSVWEQLFRYVSRLTRGDLGVSIRYFGSRSVSQVLADALPVSAIVGIAAFVIALTTAFSAAFIVIYSGSPRLAWSVRQVFIVLASTPGFFLAGVLVYIFSVRAGWLPAALWEGPSSAVLPAVALSARPSALFFRTLLVASRETLSEPFVLVARAKGLSPSRLLVVHVFRNSLVALLATVGPVLASLVTGGVVIESLFALPGLGKFFVSSVLDRDYPLVIGVTLTYAVILIGANFITEFLLLWADPRTREQS